MSERLSPSSGLAGTGTDDQNLHVALARLARLAQGGRGDSTDWGQDALATALTRIATALGVVPAVVRSRAGESVSERVHRISDGMGLALRHVSLRSGWSNCDGGPMLAFTRDDRPVALLAVAGGYQYFDPENGLLKPVRNEDDLSLAGHAVCFYRRLPLRAMGLRDLLNLGLAGLHRDVATLLVSAAAGGVLGLCIPVATGLVFDQIVPGHMRSLLFQIGSAIALLALLQWVMNLAHGVALLRIESKAKLAMQAAAVDRLIHLPAAFFRDFSAGDLGQRTLAVETIGSMLSASVAGSIFAGVFSVFGFALLFHYQAQVAWVAIGLSVVLALVVAGAAWHARKSLRLREQLAGRLNGMVLEWLNGIERIRLGGAEDRIFSRWAHHYANMREHAIRVQAVGVGFGAFNAGYRVLALAVIFGSLAWQGDERLGSGAFFAFITAFGAAFMALSQLTSTVVELLALGPLWERLRPIMDTATEQAQGGADPGKLSGAIEVGNLHFRYAEGSPNVLRGVDLRVGAGEFVAIVGASGCGKSTLLRLLLGFDKPSAGAIYFDGHDIDSLDIRAVRRQIGTVLQHDRLMVGSIFENIRGAQDITLEQAWTAVRRAGIAEQIEALPMGMHTMLGDSPGFSGGETQRLLLARALAQNPRILLLDEATSALDNRTQAIVTDNLAKLSITRVVIAHRLSTVVEADRIYVMDNGVVVEQGSYQTLLTNGGAFAQLVHQQLM